MTLERMYDDATARYEMNRLVRSVLTRHWADQDVISISCTARVVHLSGTLTKTTASDYKPADVDAIFREIAQIPMVRGIEADLENWSVSAAGSAGTWLAVPMRRAVQSAAEANQEDYRIKDAGDIKDVLDHLKKEKSEQTGKDRM